MSETGDLILGIESSCDETAAAVVAGGRRILSSVVASQVDVHRKYGGVVPELASREHLRQIVPVVREAVEQAGVELRDVDAIAVTRGPGLIGSLLVGVTYGKVLALSLGKPLIAVNHLEGHVHAVLLEAHAAGRSPQLPAVCLIVSGGHTILYRVESNSANGALRFSYSRIGGTRDDAAGEAYDKVAKMLALGYPGGPVIDRLAEHGDPRAVRFGEPKMKGNPYDFSFSGIKTAVLYYLRRNPQLQPEIEARQQALDTRGTQRGCFAGALDADDVGHGRQLSALCGRRPRHAHARRCGAACARGPCWYRAASQLIPSFGDHSNPRQRVAASRFISRAAPFRRTTRR